MVQSLGPLRVQRGGSVLFDGEVDPNHVWSLEEVIALI